MTGDTMTMRGFGRTGQSLKYVAVGALAFQAVHLVEHVAQVGYWLARPAAAPWLTPWAAEGRDALAVGGQLALGNELLHLIGNLIFVAGLAALAVYLRNRARTTPTALRTAIVLQGLHIVEHVLLTASSAFYGKAIGVSTFLGLVGGPVMTSWRVWFHFLINLAASWYAARALIDMNRAGELVGGRAKVQPSAQAVAVERGPTAGGERP